MSRYDETPIATNKDGMMLHCTKCDSGFHNEGSKNCWNCGEPLPETSNKVKE